MDIISHCTTLATLCQNRTRCHSKNPLHLTLLPTYTDVVKEELDDYKKGILIIFLPLKIDVCTSIQNLKLYCCSMLIVSHCMNNQYFTFNLKI